VNVIETQLVNI